MTAQNKNTKPRSNLKYYYSNKVCLQVLEWLVEINTGQSLLRILADIDGAIKTITASLA